MCHRRRDWCAHWPKRIRAEHSLDPFAPRRERATEKGRHVRHDEPSEQEALNRLTAIQAAAEILDDNEDLSPDERRLFLAAIQTEASRLHRMIAG